MHTLMKGALLVAALSLPVTSGAQDVAPLFEAAPAILYETHSGVDGPVFDEYFEMLVEKYAGAEGFGWGVYRENATEGLMEWTIGGAISGGLLGVQWPVRLVVQWQP